MVVLAFNPFKWLFEKITDLFEWLWEKITDLFEWFTDELVIIFKNIVFWVIDLIISAFSGILSYFVNLIPDTDFDFSGFSEYLGYIAYWVPMPFLTGLFAAWVAIATAQITVKLVVKLLVPTVG